MGKSVSKRDYHLAAQGESGLSVREYCRREGLNYMTFYKWRSRPGATARMSLPFIPVTPSGTSPKCIVRFPDGAELWVEDAGDGGSIAALVSALRGVAAKRC